MITQLRADGGTGSDKLLHNPQAMGAIGAARIGRGNTAGGDFLNPHRDGEFHAMGANGTKARWRHTR